MPKTRKERRSEQRTNYLEGRARHPYRHTPVLRASLAESPEASTSERICAQCKPILSRYADTFKELVHQGSQLKRVKHLYPNPKRSDCTHYRDLKRQNEWLRANVFDTMGNYLYCCQCIRIAFGISKQRIANQRRIKRQQSQHPLVEMTKREVEEQRLGECVVMPDGTETAFNKWWRSLHVSSLVNVRCPHARHGNAGKTSNSAKSTVMQDFLKFVDTNSQPNGRSEDSTGPTFYFLPKFSTIQTPKMGTANYAERVARSVVGKFNRAQTEAGKGTCANGSSHNWLQKHRPKVAICPHQEDYCDTCAKRKEEIRAKQTTINRLRQSAAAEPEIIKRTEDELTSIKQSFERHRLEAQGAHKYFTEVVKMSGKKLKSFKKNLY